MPMACSQQWSCWAASWRSCLLSQLSWMSSVTMSPNWTLSRQPQGRNLVAIEHVSSRRWPKVDAFHIGSLNLRNFFFFIWFIWPSQEIWELSQEHLENLNTQPPIWAIWNSEWTLPRGGHGMFWDISSSTSWISALRLEGFSCICNSSILRSGASSVAWKHALRCLALCLGQR